MRAAFSPPPRLPARKPQDAADADSLRTQAHTKDTQHGVQQSKLDPEIASSLPPLTDPQEAQHGRGLEQPVASSSRQGPLPSAALPGPITPDQVPLKGPQYSSSVETYDGDRLSTKSFGHSAEGNLHTGQRSRRSREGSRRSSSDKRPQSSRRRKTDGGSGQNALDSDDLEKIGGQDSLEVRQINLGNGQVASLILEEGRLQRIVSSNGQVAELQWQPPPLRARDQKPSKPQLAVKMHRGISPPVKQESSMALPLPVSIKRWANSLNSQRLTVQSDYGSEIFTAPVRGGPKAKSSADINKVRSVDFSARAARRGDPRRSDPRNSLLTAPAGKASSHGDLDTIRERRREVKNDWNPMSETWLPQNMTAEQAKQRSNKDLAKKELQRKRASADSGLTLGEGANPSFQPESGRSFASEPAQPQTPRANPIFASEGEISQKQKKKGIWRSIKRILSFSSKKSNQGGSSPTPDVSTARSTREPISTAAPRQREGTSRRNRSMSSIRTAQGDSEPAAEQKARARSTSSNQRYGGSKAHLAERLEDEAPNDEAIPGPSATTSDGGVRRNLAADLAVLDREQRDDRRNVHLRRATQLSEAGMDRQDSVDSEALLTPTSSDLPSSQHSVGREIATPSHTQGSFRDTSVGSTGSLVDTNDLKAALRRQRSSGKIGEPTEAPNPESTVASRSAIGRRGGLPAQSLVGPKQRTLMAGKWQKNFTEGTSGAKVDDLLHVSSLQRLARERIVEMQIVETDNTFELVWHIPLNGSASKISKTDRYLKNGEVVEAARRDGRPGLLRSQLTFTPEGHVHIRALQGEPYSAVFHDRIKLSTGGRRIKFEQKFQLLQPGVPPVKYHSIWHRIE